ncbi:MAG: MerR family transcriptional regulator [Pedobacter sp.]|nr:MAG: MerR family transcriptional regulator [Pedobacter sp.]
MQYSISDLEQLSGVHSHTIRIWEQRYNALIPHRTAGNTRYYDDQHLVRLLNIVSINQQGLKISQICKLSEEAIHELIEEDIENTISPDQQYEYYISSLLKHGMSYNEDKFSEVLSTCIDKFEMAVSYQYIIYPLLVRLGLMWRKESICAAQEHFLTNIIRRKIEVAIDALPKPSSSNTWLLFLPEDEEHEMGLLYASYELRKRGQKVIYLGPRVPFDSVSQVFEINRIDHMLIFMVQVKLVSTAQQYIDQLSEKYPKVGLHIAGNQKLIENLNLQDNVTWLTSIEHFDTYIQS